MTIGIVAKFVIHDGKTEEFERFFLGLAEQVREREPGNQLYELFESRTDANTYNILEIYRDEAALAEHRETEHFKAARAVLAKLLAARPEIQYLDGVA